MIRVPLLKIAVLIAMGALVCTAFAWAEVSVEVDTATGDYVGYHLRMNKSGPQPRIWEFKRTGKKGLHPLNVEGDALGDGLPLIAENHSGDGYPWVLWERDRGGDLRGLVWSRWTGVVWGDVTMMRNEVGGDQSAPALAFNSQGRPYLAYLEQAGPVRHVRFTIFLETDWALTIQVSDDSEIASEPSLSIVDDQTVEITYGLPDGSSKTVTVFFDDPSTITDDVYPFLTDSAEVYAGQMG